MLEPPIVLNDFSAGSFPGYEDVPLNGVEGAVNAIVRDDGAVERRGGSVYKSNTAVETPLALFEGDLAIGHRTAMFGRNDFVMLDTDDATPVALLTNYPGGLEWTHHRPVEVAGMVLLPLTTAPYRHQLLAWAGRVTNSATGYSTGTATITTDSKTVTGSGTAWAANVTAGQIIYVQRPAGHHYPAVVASVDSNTQLTLTEPWPYVPESAVSYNIRPAPFLTLEDAQATGELLYLAVTSGKLWQGQGNKVRQTSRSRSGAGTESEIYPFPFNFEDDDYHLLPAGAVVRGLQALGDGVLVFTSQGLWRIGNAAYDLTDDFGNPQQTLEQLSDQFILWGQKGIATWQGAVVVPTLEDVYLLDPGGRMVPVTGGGRTLYRSYVRAGYVPGQATVYRGHYILPILTSSFEPVTVLVWRLDRLGDAGAPMVSWSGTTSAMTPRAVISRAGTSTLVPALLGGATSRLLDLSGCFDPSAAVKADADGSAHQLSVTLRTLMGSETVAQLWRRLTVRYELDDAASDNPTMAAAYATGRPGSSFTALSGSGVEGERSKRWDFAKRAQQIRFRISTVGPAARATIRAAEVGVRRSGRL